jgi:dihydroorotate dehydrogenase (NAD+) catalytic subunit
MTPDLRVRLGALTLANPVLVAAGTFGYGLEFARSIPLERLGAVITKTLTRLPRPGHQPPRLVETPSGLLNAVGLQNVGLHAFLTEKLPALRRCGAPIIVSVLGDTAQELAELVGRLDGAEGVAAVELNLSCPNVERGQRTGDEGRAMVAQDPEATEAMVSAARAKTRKPLIAKLSPEVTRIEPVAQAAERAGADALSLVNTFTGMSVDPRARRSRLGSLTGGLSGPAIRPLAVYRVFCAAGAVRIPIVGVGGIVRAEDALEFLLVGATAVAVGTGNFADPRTPLRVLEGLIRHLRREGCASVADVRGRLQAVSDGA